VVLLLAGLGHPASRAGIGQLHRAAAQPITRVGRASRVRIGAGARLPGLRRIELALAVRRADVIELTDLVRAAAHAWRDRPAGCVRFGIASFTRIGRVDRPALIANLANVAALAHGHAGIQSQIAHASLASRTARHALPRLRVTGLCAIARDTIHARLRYTRAATRVTAITGRAGVAVVAHALRPCHELATRCVAREARLIGLGPAITDAGRPDHTTHTLLHAFVSAAESVARAAATFHVLAATVVDSAAFEFRQALGVAWHTADVLPSLARLGNAVRAPAVGRRPARARSSVATPGTMRGVAARARR